MNRQMRRAKEKRHLERQKQKMTQEGASLAVDILGVIPVYVLHTMFGFGHDRLVRYIEEWHRIMNAVTTEKVKLTTLADDVSDTGVKYDPKDGTWYDTGRKRRL